MSGQVLRRALALGLAIFAAIGVGSMLGLPLVSQPEAFEPPLLTIVRGSLAYLPFLTVAGFAAIWLAEAHALRQLVYWLLAGAAIAIASFYVLRALGAAGDLFVGRAPLKFVTMGAAGGIVYWALAGRRSGEISALMGLAGAAPDGSKASAQRRCAICSALWLLLGLLLLGLGAWQLLSGPQGPLAGAVRERAQTEAVGLMSAAGLSGLGLRIDGHTGHITGEVADWNARTNAFAQASEALKPLVGWPGVVAVLQNDIIARDDTDPRIAAENARIMAAAEAEAARRKAEEDRLAAEAEAKRKADEAEAARRKAEEERLAAEAEAKRKSEEAEAAARRKAEEDRLAAEAEAKRKADEAEAARRKAEEERLAAEAEAKRKSDEAEAAARRKAEEERLAAEADAKRKSDEAEATRRKAEEERLAAEAEAKRKADEAEATRRKAEEDRLAAEAEAKRKSDEAEAARRKAEEERLAASSVAGETKADAPPAVQADTKRQADDEAERLRAIEFAAFRACADDLAVLTSKAKVLFKSSSAELRGLHSQIMDAVAALSKRCSGMTILVSGHTDIQGSDKTNQTLSEERAEAVRAALVERGVDAKQLETRGMGSRQPSDAAYARWVRRADRRVEFIAVARSLPQTTSAP